MLSLHITQFKSSKEAVYILLFRRCGVFLLLIVSFYDHKMTRYDRLKIVNFSKKKRLKLKTTGFQLEPLRKLFTKNGKILRAGEQTGSSDIEFVDCLIHNFDLTILRGFEIYNKMQNMPMSKEVHIYQCSYQLAKKIDNQLISDILFTNLQIFSI